MKDKGPPLTGHQPTLVTGDSLLGVEAVSLPSPPPFGSCLGVDSRSSVDRLILTPGFSTLFFSSSLAPGLSAVFLSSSLASPRRADDEPRGLDRSRWKGARGQRGQQHYSHVERPSLHAPSSKPHAYIQPQSNPSPRKIKEHNYSSNFRPLSRHHCQQEKWSHKKGRP